MFILNKIYCRHCFTTIKGEENALCVWRTTIFSRPQEKTEPPKNKKTRVTNSKTTEVIEANSLSISCEHLIVYEKKANVQLTWTNIIAWMQKRKSVKTTIS